MKSIIKISNSIVYGYLILLVLLLACSEDENKEGNENYYDFNSGDQGWTGGFADYPSGQETFYELGWSVTNLPAPLNTDRKAIKVEGHNHSDDLFMFLKKKITGLQPSANYEIYFEIEFATSAFEGSIGIGGSPAHAVYFKAGATSLEPWAEKDQDNFMKMNIDKGNQAAEGADMINLGDISNGKDQEVYTLVTRNNSGIPFTVKTDGQGNLWLIVGTDSGFEGKSTLYFTKIKVTINPA